MYIPIQYLSLPPSLPPSLPLSLSLSLYSVYDRRDGVVDLTGNGSVSHSQVVDLTRDPLHTRHTITNRSAPHPSHTHQYTGFTASRTLHLTVCLMVTHTLALVQIILPTTLDPYHMGPLNQGPSDPDPHNLGPYPSDLAPCNMGPLNQGPLYLDPFNLAPSDLGPLYLAPCTMDPLNLGPPDSPLLTPHQQ